MVVDRAVDHVRPDVDAEQPDDQNPESIAHDCERNHKSDEDDSSPPALEEHMGREQARDQEHPTGVNATALLGDNEHNRGQPEYGALAQQWSAGDVEKKS